MLSLEHGSRVENGRLCRMKLKGGKVIFLTWRWLEQDNRRKNRKKTLNFRQKCTEFKQNLDSEQIFEESSFH